VDTTEEDSNRVVDPNQGLDQPDLPGCGPGGRGFESRRSPLRDSLQTGGFAAPPGSSSEATGVNSGSNLSSEQELEGSDEPPERRPLGDETELFRQYDRPLRRMVQRIVNTSPDIVDD